MLHQIGVGALGPVFRTYEPTRDRLVAVKVFRLDVTPEQAQALADELSRAADVGLFHPSIVEPLAAGVEGTVAYRAEEYVAAESLDVAMRHYAPAALDKTLPFITQLAGAIDFARAAGVGHGALHPRDVFVTPDEARATGFGVVEALERVGQRAPVRRPYTAPERIAGGAWSTPADVFSLAAITYELLTAKRPAGTGEQIASLAGDNVGGHAAALHAVLSRAMHDDPAQRYPTALAFAAALEAAASGARPADALHAAALPAAAPIAGAAGTPTGPISAAPPLLAEPEPEPEPEPEEPPEPVEPEEREQPDDILSERDEDEAHHQLLLSEAEFDRFADDFAAGEPPDHVLRRDSTDLLGLGDEIVEEQPEVVEAAQPDPRPYAPVEEEVREELLTGGGVYETVPHPVVPGEAAFYRGSAQHERSRPAMLPMAVTLIVGLLLGFVAGYAVGGREKPAGTDASTASPTGTPASGDSSAQPSGKAWSERAVAPAQQPPAIPPAVPEEVPAASPERPASGRPAATAPRRGRILVQSTPSRAGVTVNGRWRGRTPLTLEDVAFGPYEVRVVQRGYATAREEFSLSSGTPAHTMNVRLRREERAAAPAPPAARSQTGSGSMYIDSRPRGARVFVDGNPVGVTPARVPGVKAGSHTVRIELADHRTWLTTTRVEPGQERRVSGSLERIR